MKINRVRAKNNIYKNKYVFLTLTVEIIDTRHLHNNSIIIFELGKIQRQSFL